MKPETRHDERGKLVLMARAGGYVMVRRPGCVPFVLSEKDWQAMPDAPHPGAGSPGTAGGDE